MCTSSKSNLQAYNFDIQVQYIRAYCLIYHANMYITTVTTTLFLMVLFNSLLRTIKKNHEESKI